MTIVCESYNYNRRELEFFLFFYIRYFNISLSIQSHGCNLLLHLISCCDWTNFRCEILEKIKFQLVYWMEFHKDSIGATNSIENVDSIVTMVNVSKNRNRFKWFRHRKNKTTYPLPSFRYICSFVVNFFHSQRNSIELKYCEIFI